MMELEDARSVSAWVTSEIRSRAANLHLQPFGDSPFEADISLALREHFVGMSQEVLTEGLGRAVQSAVARVLAGDARGEDYDLLVSALLVVRFAGVSLDRWSMSDALSFLRKHAMRDSKAVGAVATFVRTLARDRGAFEPRVLEELAVAREVRIRRPAIEALGRQGGDSFVSLLESHLVESPSDDDQLLWTLAHLESVSRAIANAASVRETSFLRGRFRAALSAIDPSGNAYVVWLTTIDTPPTTPRRFESLDWRRSSSDEQALKKAA